MCSFLTIWQSSGKSLIASPCFISARSSRSRTRASLFKRPLHPYTKSLIAAVPIPEVFAERARHAQHLRGEVPSIADPPGGCRFRTRCPIAKPVCAEEAPVLNELGSGQAAACHFAGQF